jgi:hypothetical protein
LRRKIPFRKVGGRHLMFIEDEITAWIQKAPGVTLDDCMKRDQ